MIIDFHTHVFPDELASRAITTLLKDIGDSCVPVTDGKISGLKKNMDEWNIDISVIQPVVTKPTQIKTTNEWVRSICSDRIIGFGGIFPGFGDYKKDIDFIAGLGLRGIKFHAEYQNFILDDGDMLKIYDYALNKGMILLFHAGYDPAFPAPYKSSPQRFANVARAMGGGKIVAAHLGGLKDWDAVERDLAGSDIYLDTSVGFEHYSEEQFLRIVAKHGANRILFASDSPWSNAKTEIEHIKALPLPEDDINAILSGNARRLLEI